MTDKITLSPVGNLQDTTTAASTINQNFATIQAAFDDTLSRDGTTPNQMEDSLDMNSNQILNLPSPGSVNSPARLIDVVSNPTIEVPPVGTSGATVPLLNGNNTFSGDVTFTGTVTLPAGTGSILPTNNTFTGTNTFANTTTLNGPVTVAGNITSAGNNTSTGTTNLFTTNVTGALSASGSLITSGTNFFGNTNVSGTLNTSGSITSSGTNTYSGTNTFSGTTFMKNGAFSANTNGNNFQFVPGNPNLYVLYPPTFTKFNIGGYYNTSNGRFTPPSGATLVRLDACIWVLSGFSTNGSYTCKWIKNFTVTGGNVEISGVECFAGIAGAASFNSLYIQAGGYDACSPGDYYGLFLFIDTPSPGGTVVTIDGNQAHTFITGAVVG